MNGGVIDTLNNDVYAIIDVFGVEFWLTQTMVSLWVVMAIAIALAVIVRLNMKKWTDTPKGLQSVIEAAVELFDRYVVSTMGEKNRHFGSYFFGITVAIWLMNTSGLWLMRPATADLATTTGLALATFALIHITSFKRDWKDYFKQYISPSPVMLPLNLIGELAKPVALAFRLFGAVLGGFIIITLMYSLTPMWVRLGLPIALHAFFDVFAGSLQTFIFLTLSMTFIRARSD